MNRNDLASFYRTSLLDDVIPFWLRHGLDPVHGGVFTSLDRDGRVIDTDKPIWAQGRFAWLMATLHRIVEPRDEWRDAALSALRFVDAHGFDDDGRMRFLVTQAGEPLRTRRYAYSEAFAAMAFAAVGAMVDDPAYQDRALELLDTFVAHMLEPGRVEPKVHAGTRPMRSIGPLMITMNVAQVVRATTTDHEADHLISQARLEIEEFLDFEKHAVLETIACGDSAAHFETRTLNPGHAIEAAWFILHEGRFRDDDTSIELGLQMLEWMWSRGWDEEHGGLFSFVSIDDRPIQELTAPMKYWWPHCEAIIATLLASEITGEETWARRHQLVHDWAHAHFPDPEYGEWFGYLDRSGAPSGTLKGNHWKGPFHVPRMQLYCWKLLEGGRLPF